MGTVMIQVGTLLPISDPFLINTPLQMCFLLISAPYYINAVNVHVISAPIPISTPVPSTVNVQGHQRALRSIMVHLSLLAHIHVVLHYKTRGLL